MISISCLTPMSPVMKFTIRTLLVGRACGTVGCGSTSMIQYDRIDWKDLRLNWVPSRWQPGRCCFSLLWLPSFTSFICCASGLRLWRSASSCGQWVTFSKQKPMFRLQSLIYLHQLISGSKVILYVGILFFMVFFGNIGQKDFHILRLWSCKPWVSLLQVLSLWPSSFRCARRYCYLFAAMYIQMDVGLCRLITRHGTTSTLAQPEVPVIYFSPWGVLRWDRWAPPNGTRWWIVLLLGVLSHLKFLLRVKVHVFVCGNSYLFLLYWWRAIDTTLKKRC